MIASALRDGIRWQTPEQALAVSLAAAHARLQIGQPASRMDGKSGIVRAIEPDGYDVFVLVELPDGRLTRELAGMWHSREVL